MCINTPEKARKRKRIMHMALLVFIVILSYENRIKAAKIIKHIDRLLPAACLGMR